MKLHRFVSPIALAALAVSVIPASASVPSASGVKGGGFLRDIDQTKATLTISASDGGLTGDSGQAQFVRHEPGSRADSVHIKLLCVNVLDSVALSSGLGSDGRMYLIVVKDNGQGYEGSDEFGVAEMVSAYSACLTGVAPTSGVLGSVEGGNFQVFSG